MTVSRHTRHQPVWRGSARRARTRQIARAAAAAITLLSILLLPSAVSAEPTATLRTFVGSWYGHTRSLVVDSRGVAHEFLGSGCCDPLVRLRLHLYAPRGTANNATVKAYVSWVHILDARAFGPSFPRPRTGQVVTWRLHNGVLTEPATHIVYCDSAADEQGRCGA
jgi:hypothetical protein